MSLETLVHTFFYPSLTEVALAVIWMYAIMIYMYVCWKKMHECMHACMMIMNVCMHVCIYICKCKYVYIHVGIAYMYV